MSPPPVFPRPAAALFIVFGAWLFTGVLVVALGGVEEGRVDVGVLGISEAVAFGLIGTLAARAVPPPQAERLGLRGLGLSFVPVLLLLLPVPVVMSELSNWAQLWFPSPEEEALDQARQALGLDSPLGVFETAIVVVGLLPVVEEWLYRGVIQQGLVSQLGRFSGVLLTAALFSLAHLQPSGSAAAFAAAFVASLPLGLLLGALRLASGSLLAPIFLHAVSNGVGLAALVLSERFPVAGLNAPGDHTPLWLLVPSVAAVALGTVPVLRLARAAEREEVAAPPDWDEED